MIYIIYGFFLYYFLKYIILNFKFNENFTDYCTPVFSNKGMEFTISPMSTTNKYMSVNPYSSYDNIGLTSIPNNWILEKTTDINFLKNPLHNSISENGIKNSIKNGIKNCPVYIKTKSTVNKNDKDTLYYYITQNKKEDTLPGIGNSYISASLFGKSKNQIWYIIDINNLKYTPKDSYQKKILKIINQAKDKFDTKADEMTKYVLIMKNPESLYKENESLSFLTFNSFQKDNFTTGTATLLKMPSVYSVWKLNITTKGKPDKQNEFYKPTFALNDFPNMENNENETFMTHFLPLWNRTWYYPNGDELKSFTVNINTSENIINGFYNVKNPFSTGTVVMDDHTIYTVQSAGSDMLYGNISAASQITGTSQINSKIILKMIPRSNKPDTLPDGIPMIQGWIETSGNITSICASNDKNLKGVCVSPKLPEGQFQLYLLKNDLSPINLFSESNLSKGTIESFGNINNCLR